MLTSTRNLITTDGVPLVSMTFAVWLVETLVWMTVGAAAGLHMSLLEGLYLVALASLFSMIPSGPAYAGTQDAAAVFGIKAIGGTPVKYAMRNECCGAYVGLKDENLPKKRSEKIIDNAVQNGAEMIVTACPLCYYNLKQNCGDRSVIAYFTELLAEALGVKDNG